MASTQTTASQGAGGTRVLSDADAHLVDAYWRAANYLSVGQIYLLDNPLLKEPLRPEHVKPRLLGHWGTTPGLNFVYAHMNRAIRNRGLDAIYVLGPGHGGPAAVANAYLEGTYSELYPRVTRDEEGLRQLFRQFSFPGGIPSHVAPETPGSIHEGGELGYALSHAYGAAFDNPGLLVCCVVGDGEAETGPLATSWHSNKFLDPATDGAVLPVLHLNGYKIANPAVLARIGDEELTKLLEGYGHAVHWVSGDDPAEMHLRMAATLDTVLEEIASIQRRARTGGEPGRPRWPMIVLRTPKGWTGPKTVDGLPVEGTWRAHQVPLAGVRTDRDHLAQLEAWMRSYRPGELFDDAGALVGELADLPPKAAQRMSANPHANGGLLLRDLELPDFRDYAVAVDHPGTSFSEATAVLGTFLRDVVRANPDRFRLFGPDETASNRLQGVFEATERQWDAERLPTDDHLAPEGRVVEVLSEHQCQGWLEGYLLTGRHGLFNCYEAFVHIVDSMFNQHAKWLKTTRQIPWRRPIASLNYLLSSHVWRQDHNGFSHQDPGFIDHVVNKKAEVIRVYLPPDANCLLSVMDHCLRSRHYVNVVVAGKQPSLDYLSMDDAILHCTRGLGIWEWASNDEGDPDVVLACCGDVPTLEALAATDILRRELPDLRVRFVNVVDLMRLQPGTEHPHGLSDSEFDTLFTADKPVIFAHHGYPWLIHRLTYRRTNHANLHVRGYKEEGTTTTPFDMVMLNDLDRFHLVMDVVDRVPGLGSRAAALRQAMVDERLRARAYTRARGEDVPAISGWTWPH
ncbi:MAG: phosphoketolase family protein [Actinomycetota bacterium]|jgi:xylulose-5-phosphate/fructose-6-phosphate phosphoketolase|nr:phosphoketolase family protein [Actinomycetota bacterium]